MARWVDDTEGVDVRCECSVCRVEVPRGSYDPESETMERATIAWNDFTNHACAKCLSKHADDIASGMTDCSEGQALATAYLEAFHQLSPREAAAIYAHYFGFWR